MKRNRNKRTLQVIVLLVLGLFLLSTVAVSLVGLNFGPTDEQIEQNYENFGLSGELLDDMEISENHTGDNMMEEDEDMEAAMVSGVILKGELE